MAFQTERGKKSITANFQCIIHQLNSISWQKKTRFCSDRD